jgi:hypothetical protein
LEEDDRCRCVVQFYIRYSLYAGKYIFQADVSIRSAIAHQCRSVHDDGRAFDSAGTKPVHFKTGRFAGEKLFCLLRKSGSRKGARISWLVRLKALTRPIANNFIKYKINSGGIENAYNGSA